ncbi:Stp1/IreP family PP2C-type Ser/Thr phosphatase [Compostimonas suwonensis]|uniref:Protein phosphatase n=1 Tax=Compostimonas suwonensis TaxID=1048394 RepID=A0A2M9C421_9MICO|nr:Stp1/IreP family PP2C-type Ser/Thr phosphatase [Compostimonas suwonensis]PJJ65275.1 protein phosphatase [Compostimonas suwonensis]
MATQTKGAAVSHVGKIRSNNQDSGYAGRELFVVADGMGGHAGGDVASAIAVKRIIEADTDYPTVHDAEFALQAALVAANAQLSETVFEHAELTGMGTTVSAILRVGDQIAIAHIGDSRIYLYRQGELSQITTDHTFVQRLVDSGRITEEEAMVHPRRSVLMRVLGDVDSSPEIDTQIMSIIPGDRWLICSDGLSGVVMHDDIESILASSDDVDTAADRLVKASLDGGAPDNVTVVVVDVTDAPVPPAAPVTVGSASVPLAFDGKELAPAPRALRLPSLRHHPVRQTHFEPESEDYLDELIEEDARRARRRKITWLVGIVLVVAALVVAAIIGYQWTQSLYFVGVDADGTIAIYRGIQQNLGPISLSSLYTDTGIDVDSLRVYDRMQVEQTISADSLQGALDIVDRLKNAGN